MNGTNRINATCPACNSKKARETSRIGVVECVACGAIHGQCYLGDSYQIVRPFFDRSTVPAEDTRYFDLTCIGSSGVTRRHGWFNPATRLVTQIG